MDNIEIAVFDEINDYKEKIYFFNFRQWLFAILIIVLVVPTYIILKEIIGDEITSYIVIAIAGILGFVGFVKIHELPAEKFLPYLFRHYFSFAKPICYVTDEQFKLQHQKKRKKNLKENEKSNKETIKHEKSKAKKLKIEKNKISKKKKNEINESELLQRLSKLSKEQQDALFKLLER